LGVYVPVGVVDLGLLAQELLLAGLVGVVAADLVAVLLGLEERHQVQTRPHLLAGKLTVYKKGTTSVCC
jgi:ABC-type transport system involved in cytochrome c biogenesis permease component